MRDVFDGEGVSRIDGLGNGLPKGDMHNGAALFVYRTVRLHVIFSDGGGWDHVSVSHPQRCPRWEEMEAVKRRFFKHRETAMQLHVPPADHVNCHRYCLHLWRPQDFDIPRPPDWMVA